MKTKKESRRRSERVPDEIEFIKIDAQKAFLSQHMNHFLELEERIYMSMVKASYKPGMEEMVVDWNR